jgi:hypothetical protein
MSDDQPTQTGDLGPMPEAEIEPGEENPGGADALPADDGDNVAADLDPAKNPAVDESPDPLKAAFSGGEDTDTEATRSDEPAGDEDTDVEESPA